MSERQPNQPSLLRRIAGYFYHFDDEEPGTTSSSKIKTPKHVVQPAQTSQPAQPAQPAQAGHPAHSSARDPEKPHGNEAELTPAASITQPGNPAVAPVEATAPEILATNQPLSAATSLADEHRPEPLIDGKPAVQVLSEAYAGQKNPAFPFPASMPESGHNESPELAASTTDHQQDPPVRPKYKPIVTFSNVTKIFNHGTSNEFMALKNVSFEIEDLPDVGEFIALVGPSGCGKSTVLNLIQGFQEVGPPTLGEVLVRGKKVTGPGRDRGMIFQKYSSFPHLTVLQNVMFGLQLNRESLGYPDQVMEKLAREMIDKVGMKGHEDKYPYQLSGGQQQRVAIARTLVLKPRIILMDEPFSALDEPTRIEMQELITALWHEVEATVFIVTHSLAEAVYLSDRIFMFQANPGRLARQIAVTPELIGKHAGMSPLEVQESRIFNSFLKDITDEFVKIGGSD